MLGELIAQSWSNLSRNRTRSILTMLGIVWGIVAVALLMSYGGGFRAALVRAFNAFGKSAVVIWPGQTSERPAARGPGAAFVSMKATGRRSSKRPPWSST